jgi:arylsulfatase
MDNSLQSRLLTARPSAVSGRTEFNYTGENVGIPVGNAPDILDKDYTITSVITIRDGGAEGVIVTLGGRFGGYALLLRHSFNWWFKSSLFKTLGVGLLVLGLLLILFGKSRKWGRWGMRIGYSLVLLSAL